MKPSNKQPRAVETPAMSRPERAMAFAIAAAVAIIPIALWPWADDSSRLPKALLLRATAIVVVALAGIGLLWSGRVPWKEWRSDRFVFLAGAIVAWWGISAVVASNRNLSFPSWLWVVSGAVIAVATYRLAPALRPAALWPLLFAGVVNAASCLLSLVLPASPYWPRAQGRAYGFLGGAHDAGAFLVVPALVATAAAVIDRRRRVWWVAAALLCAAAIVTTRTAGAVVAYAAGAFVLLLLRSVRWAAAVLVVALVAALALPRSRAELAPLWSGDVIAIDRMSGGRILPFLAAGRMFVQHPLLGVGPGCFAWEYFPHKIALEGEYPVLLRCMTRDIQFGEAHNDHLQVLAETGLPGYLLFLAALAFIAVSSRRAEAAPDDWRGRFARTAGAPLAAAAATLSLAEFPFEIAAASLAIVYSAALCAAWSRNEPIA